MSITSYLALLSHARERESSSPPRTLLEETESDRARLVFSSPFRRLQQKAQVYSLEDNAAVRSRLTHSLEVAHIGRFLSQLVIKRLNLISTNFGLSGNEAAFQNLVETACLMHDIGNPPFGHFGEAAISEWFRRNAVDLAREASHGMGAEIDSARPKFADFEEFDGNCQGLRIISRLQWNRDEFGLNLSFSQLATYLKYVTSASGLDGSSQFKKKPGYFSSEAELVQRIWKKLGMQPHTRFPLTYLMEAADDIAYCISDIEDGIEKGLITEPDFFHWINNRWKKNTIEGAASNEQKHCEDILARALTELGDGVPMKSFTNFRAGLTTTLANYAADKYVDEHLLVLNGIAAPLLSNKSSPHCAVLEVLREFAMNNLYNSAAATNNELSGYSIISGLLEHHRPLLNCDWETFELISEGLKRKTPSGQRIVVQSRLFNRLPKKYRRAYQNAIKDLTKSNAEHRIAEWFCRAHLVVDYISGMTDDFSLETFQLLSGIRVGTQD